MINETFGTQVEPSLRHYMEKIQHHLEKFNNTFMLDIVEDAKLHGYSMILEGCNNYLSVYDKYTSTNCDLFRAYFESYCELNYPDLIPPQILQEMKDDINAEIRIQSTISFNEGIVGLLRNRRCTKEEIAEIFTRLLNQN